MKLNDSFRFPYPVLTETSSDYTDGAIELDLSVEERPAKGELRITYDLRVSSKTILSQLQEGACSCYLSIVCRETFFNEFYPLAAYKGLVEVPGGNLHGRVQLRAIIVRTKDGICEALDLQDEYQNNKFVLEQGAVIAWTLPQFVSVGMEKLAPMESIFRLSLDSGLPEGKFGVAYDQEFVSILAAEKLLGAIHAMRAKSLTKPVVLNAIYSPAVVAVLDVFRSGGEFAEKRWFRIIKAKADLLGLDLVDGTPLDLAQKLLKLPAGRLCEFAERIP